MIYTYTCYCPGTCEYGPCTNCGEDHGSHKHSDTMRLCRDCDIEYSLDSIQCSGCKRMRYHQDDEQSAAFAARMWGERCVCDPQPPSVYEANRS